MKTKYMIPLVLTVSLFSMGSAQAVAAGNISDATTNSTVVGAKVGMIPATSSVQDLEDTLKKAYVGTYTIFGSLPEEKKLALYSAVKQGGNIKDFRNQVIRVRLKR
ncbi:hypothetical protein [Thiolapillus sp.]